jgi:hypothetical protein
MFFRHLPAALRLALTPKHGRQYRDWLASNPNHPLQRVDSVVITCYGVNYIGEATLAAWFADSSLLDVGEVIIVSDQPSAAFGELPERVRVETVALPGSSRPAFDAIWNSRLLKLNAPLKAKGALIAMVDSDLMVLRDFTVAIAPNTVLGTFRNGRMAVKVKGLTREATLLKGARRPFLETHINGGFLIAHRDTWERLCPLWTEIFLSLWTPICDRPPTDQLPLAMALDRLGIMTGDLGILYNWPVSKQIGGKTAPVPREVIGAHGGFPLTEYEKLKLDRDAALSFHDQHYTRKVRYQNA